MTASANLPRLSTEQMAGFVSRGFLAFEAVVPPDINAQAMEELPLLFRSWLNEFRAVLADRPGDDHEAPIPRSGTALADAYASDSAFGRMVRVPEIAGAIASLVGSAPVVDHHFVHLKSAGDLIAQGLHCDAIIDAGAAFDIQLFWFPHDVASGAGGTRFVPGSHLRRVNMDDVSRYHHLAGEQYFAGPGGTVLIFHQGLWHAGAPNRSDTLRVMGKLRLNPTEPQVRLWDTSDLAARNVADDHVFARSDAGTVASMLRGGEPWYEPSVHRLEIVQRSRLWRYLSNDDAFDVDWYLTRTERRAALEAQSLQCVPVVSTPA
jgi:Phytanoyl-CoA dioxygenase (PhyH)